MIRELVGHPLGPTSSEFDELDRLRHTLGQQTFNEIQRVTWNVYIVETSRLYAPDIWHYVRRCVADIGCLECRPTSTARRR